MSTRPPSTLIELLHRQAERHGPAPLYVFLKDGESEEFTVTFEGLDRRARTIAAGLRPRLARGDQALLVYPNGPEFAVGLFGAMAAGAVPVPTAVHGLLRLKEALGKIEAIARAAHIKAVLTNTRLLEKARDVLAATPLLASLPWINTDELPEVTPGAAEDEAEIGADTTAYYQFTSGSTAVPKGVVLAHGNLMHNLSLFDHRWDHGPGSALVTWMPPFHDLGLIYGLLLPLYAGIRCLVMSPSAFIQRPMRWIEAMSRYRATHTMGPNFAYDLCARKVTPEDCERLDLGAWRVALNGAETVRWETVERFTSAFAPAGLRPGVMCPAYGLAEATCVVTKVIPGEDLARVALEAEALEAGRVQETSPSAPRARLFVGCGAAMPGLDVKIVDPDAGRECRPDEVGEIWIAGPSVARGYHAQPEASAETFAARLDTRAGPFARTGDLGFVRRGQFFIAGRRKDLIIIRGENHYPQDVEWTVGQSHPVLRAGSAAAFAVDAGGEERLVVVQEIDRHFKPADTEAVCAAIRTAVAEGHGLQTHAVALIKPGSIFKTTSGKIQRARCRTAFLNGGLELVGGWTASDDDGTPVARQAPTPMPAAEGPEGSREARVARVLDWLQREVARRAGVPLAQVRADEPFARYGFDSRQLVALTGDLGEWLGLSLPPGVAYDHPSLRQLAQHVVSEPGPGQSLPARPAAPRSEREPLAVVGLGCRFPGAAGAEAFWQLLAEGRDAVGDLPARRAADLEVFGPAGRLPQGGYLPQVDAFDANFFKMSPREAESVDPQQRLLLEVAWEGLEDAGIAPPSLAGSQAGVFVGISSSDYLQLVDLDTIGAYAPMGHAHSVAAARLSYLLDLRGPSLAVDTACSSSLVAVHLACQSLRRRECDLALAGGVSLILAPHWSLALGRAGMLAPGQRCRTFDADADGYVRGEGCGLVVLKRLSDAQAAGDRVLAVIAGTAVNQDGRSNGLTAPNGPAQERVIRAALADAGVAPAQVGYVEAHGTGTRLGDPIEFDALRTVLGEGRTESHSCRLGSVKTNIGHLEAAAGVAGLIKTVLALAHESVPPHLHLRRVNPDIRLEGSPFAIPRALEPWPRGTQPRRAGISSFGFGGTNAHAVLEEAPDARVPEAPRETRDGASHVLVLSAHSDTALATAAGALGEWIEAHPDAVPADICHSARLGRAQLEHRLALVAESRDELLGELRRAARREPLESGTCGHATGAPRLAFLFTGQGAQRVGMAGELFETCPVFRKTLEACHEILLGTLETPLLELIFPTGGSTPEHETRLARARHAQPAMFALEYALARLWLSLGARPEALLGHSLGEYVAACVAGVFDVEDALRLVTRRGELLESLPGDGAMLAVFAPRALVAARMQPFGSALTVAIDNGPNYAVVSGEAGAIRELARQCADEGVSTRDMALLHGFHSAFVEPALEPLRAAASQVTHRAPRIPLVSNVSGRFFDADLQPGPDYWARHARQTVQFGAGLEALAQAGCNVMLEIGPSAALTSVGRQMLGEDDFTWIASMRKRVADGRAFNEAAGRLFVAGAALDFGRLGDGRARRRWSLPAYPFERERHWLAARPAATQAAPAHDEHWPALLAAGRKQGDEAAAEIDGLAAQTAALDDLCAAHIARALAACGLHTLPAGHDPARQLALAPQYAQLAQRYLEALAGRGLLRRLDEQTHALHAPGDAELATLRERARGAANAQPHLLALVERCAQHLRGVLQGGTNARDIFFPGGSFDDVERLYRESPWARFFNRILAGILAHVGHASGGRRLALLEVGAGLGGTTTWLLPALDGVACDYVYTDLSEFFLYRAREAFRDRAGLHYATLDVERDPAAQGFPAGRYDVVVAANVLHATRDVRRSVEHLHGLLAPGGLLLLWEITRPAVWFDLTFGLLVPPVADTALRGAQPLLPAPAWSRLVAQAGFAHCACLPGERDRGDDLGQHVIVARRALGGAASTTRSTPHPPTERPTMPDTRSPAASVPVTSADDAASRALAFLRTSLGRLLRTSAARIQPQSPFLDMGADSIVLVELSRVVQDKLGIKLSVRQLFEELSTPAAVARHLAAALPAAAWAQVEDGSAAGTPASAAPPAEPAPASPPASSVPAVPLFTPAPIAVAPWRSPAPAAHGTDGALERIVSQQLELMRHQLDVLRAERASAPPELAALRFAAAPEALAAPPLALTPSAVPAAPSTAPVPPPAAVAAVAAVAPAPASATPKAEPFVPFAPPQTAATGLSPQQQAYLDDFVTRYVARTAASRRFAEQHRTLHADYRNSLGFRLTLKNLLYPIVARESRMARLWDLDGNEYIDVTMAFGATLFGHNPDFLRGALQAQLERGIHVGPQCDLVGEVVRLFAELTGTERVAFANSGTEAVMTAVRLARTATGRTRIALFSGSYHGHSDGTLARAYPLGEPGQAVPMAPGVPDGIVQDVLVLPYGDPRALEIVAARRDELAAVLVEPVQSRRPDLQPAEFLKELRRLTEASGTALVFDEIITGFRIHPAGAQGYFGVQADLATYGKVVAGGMPIGVVAGRARFMDGIDGGQWAYDDGSVPMARTTFFAGTFSKHPLTMAAAREVLRAVKAGGTGLYDALDQRTGALQRRLNEHFEQRGVALRIARCGSLFRFVAAGNYSVEYQPLDLNLLFYHLVYGGVYIWEGHTCFLSTAHTDVDCDAIHDAVVTAVERQCAGGFLGGPRPNAGGTQAPSPARPQPPAAVAREAAPPESVPLSKPQREVWVHAQMSAESATAYNEAVALRLRGKVHVEALEAALRRVVERHEALRTGFDAKGERQQIRARATLSLETLDLVESGPAGREERRDQWARELITRPFALAEPPLLRVGLARESADAHLLLLVAHHLVIDGWSFDLAVRDLAAFYGEAVGAGPASLPPAVPYRRQLDWLEGQARSGAWTAPESYWLARYADGVPVLDLPTDRPRGAVQSFEGARRAHVMPAEAYQRLKDFSREQQVTVFMTLLAAYTLLLHRRSGQDDVVVGVPVAGRYGAGIEHVVGYCVNLLPVRSVLCGEPSFARYLQDLRRALLDAFEHQEYPLAELLGRLNPPRNPARMPLISVLFNFEKLDVPGFAGLDSEPATPPLASVKYDLTLNGIERNGELHVIFDYCSALFDTATADRMLAELSTLLEAGLTDPAASVRTLPLLNAGDRRRVLLEWNETRLDETHEACLHELFEAQARRTPQAPAVVAGARRLSYAELDAQASAWAHRLRELGVGPEVRVGVCLPRSHETIVALLAVLKAGGAYVPLDMAYPPERLAFMLEDGDCQVLLTGGDLSARIPRTHARVVDLDAERTAVARRPAAPLPRGARPHNLAYVIYTSGSTGRPKGVAIEHRSTASLLAWARTVFEPADLRQVLASTSLCFDLSVFEIFLPLCTGGAVRVVPDALALVQADDAHEVTLINTVPSVAAELLRYDAWPRALRVINLAGEPIKPGLIDALYERSGAGRVYNLYGPSETTTYSTFVRLEPGDPGVPPIGRPVGNTEVYLLDGHQQPVPVGVVGEIYIGGAGVARGYLGRPELTAERFVPDLLGHVPGQRLYRTGDLGRYRPDGTLDFLGRVDHQVKVRGFRIELEEIEAALGRHPGVAERVVVAREDTPGDKRLVAYLVPRAGAAPESAELRRFLKAMLPEYMVPSAFVFLEGLPLTPNGKLDRRALPSPDGAPGDNAARVAPRTDLERELADIWRQALRRAEVGVHDDFFALGGNSFLATHLVFETNARFGVQLFLRHLLKAPTVAELAGEVLAAQAQQADAEAVAEALAEIEQLPAGRVQTLLAGTD